MLMQFIKRVFLVSHRVDFRKGHAGLLAECYRLGLKPYHGDVILFIGRCKSKIKVLHADSNGLWVSYKKFDEDTIKTKLKFVSEPSTSTISTAELALIVQGDAYELGKITKKRCIY